MKHILKSIIHNPDVTSYDRRKKMLVFIPISNILVPIDVITIIVDPHVATIGQSIIIYIILLDPPFHPHLATITVEFSSFPRRFSAPIARLTAGGTALLDHRGHHEGHPRRRRRRPRPRLTCSPGAWKIWGMFMMYMIIDGELWGTMAMGNLK